MSEQFKKIWGQVASVVLATLLIASAAAIFDHIFVSAEIHETKEAKQLRVEKAISDKLNSVAFPFDRNRQAEFESMKENIAAMAVLLKTNKENIAEIKEILRGKK